jgi:pimeloyl-ACP methyl ester carboxylesterase
MGGWIMLHVALALGQQVKGLLGVAAAPDFTRDLVSQEMDDAQRDELASTGRVHLSSDYDPQGYPITETLISDGETQCLLDSPVRISAPVRLLQGFADTEVPWRTALRLSEALAAHDVRVQLLKDGDHRLSSPAQLDLLGDTLAELLETVSQD